MPTPTISVWDEATGQWVYVASAGGGGAGGGLTEAEIDAVFLKPSEILAGANITVTPGPAAGAVTIAATGGGTSGTWPYEWKTSTAATDPAHGYIKANAALATNYTEIFISVYDKNNQAFLALNDMATGSKFHLYEAGQINTWNMYRLTETPVLQGSPAEWARLSVEFLESGPQPFTPGGNTQVVLTIQSGVGGGGGGGLDQATADTLYLSLANGGLVEGQTVFGNGIELYGLAQLQFLQVSNGAGTAGHVLTSTDTYGNAHWAAPTGGGGGGAPTRYTHTQAVLATTWTVVHNLGGHPAVAVEDAVGTVLYGTVQYLNDSTLTVSFYRSATGRVTCT